MKKWFFHPALASVIALLAVLFYLSLLRTDANLQKTAAVVPQVKTQTKILEENMLDAQRQLYEATSAAWRDQMIRDQLLVQKEGEYTVLISNVDVKSYQAKKQALSEVVEVAPLEQWLNLMR